MAVVGEVDWMHPVACKYGVMSKVYLYGSLHSQKQREAEQEIRKFSEIALRHPVFKQSIQKKTGQVLLLNQTSNRSVREN